MIKKIFPTLLLLIIAVGLSIGVIEIFHAVEIIDKEKTIYPYLSKIPIIGEYFKPPKPIPYELLKEEELRRLDKVITLRLTKIKEKEIALKAKEEELNNKAKELEDLEDELYNQRLTFEEEKKRYEEAEQKWERLAMYYEKMSPDAAAKILLNVDDETTIEILKRLKEPTVAVIMMKLDPTKAGELSRKMSK